MASAKSWMLPVKYENESNATNTYAMTSMPFLGLVANRGMGHVLHEPAPRERDTDQDQTYDCKVLEKVCRSGVLSEPLADGCEHGTSPRRWPAVPVVDAQGREGPTPPSAAGRDGLGQVAPLLSCRRSVAQCGGLPPVTGAVQALGGRVGRCWRAQHWFRLGSGVIGTRGVCRLAGAGFVLRLTIIPWLSRF